MYMPRNSGLRFLSLFNQGNLQSIKPTISVQFCVISDKKSATFFFCFRLFITTAVSFSASKISQLLFFFHYGFSAVTFPLMKLIGCKIIDLSGNLTYLHMCILWICFCRQDIVCVMWDIHSAVWLSFSNLKRNASAKR